MAPLGSGFEVDVLECPRCGGRMRLLATQAILDCLELPSRAPPTVLELGADEFEASA